MLPSRGAAVNPLSAGHGTGTQLVSLRRILFGRLPVHTISSPYCIAVFVARATLSDGRILRRSDRESSNCYISKPPRYMQHTRGTA